ncbi:hypothetical protein NM208_g939 [Fusarium decemcellulare]|uniref:Uncharacterized protein n=1 Tax=Fusarium decemcellulare TaxID=57161 RepID=A0ACC1SXZ4_9HYPO|nr:hypothetical protein NM208_g939 [Fusarium decemcellulare]
MATGLEVLGTASAVLQVISFACDVAGACKRVYDGKPTADDDLEEHAQRMSDAVSRIQTRCETLAKSQSSNDHTKLSDIAEDCSAAARELESEVRFVTGLHKKGNLLRAAHAALRASSHRKKIDRLEISLSRCRQVMEIEMMAHLCSQSDAIEIQQRDGFRDIEMDVQNLVVRISQGHTKLEDLIKSENDVTREVIAQETVKASGAINEHVTAEFQALSANTEAKARYKTFLQGLKFPEMNQRYNDLMSSHNASFNGVFASYKEMISKENDIKGPRKKNNEETRSRELGRREIDQVWAEFVNWLQSSDSLFCIRGKPGSGKSTLVKFIIDNKTTKQLLSHWNSNAAIISHFFWKIGSSSQNSIKGLLCSLVYRSLDGNREIAEQVLDRFPHLSTNTHYNDWSTEDLRTVLYFILENDTRHLCIFIDGLDEICNRDGLTKLTQTIEEILKFPRIKMCVATRPETLVMSWLKKMNVPGILLEDLTRPDMRTFVQKELKPFLTDKTISPDIHRKLMDELIWKAQGVFLWLHLAIRSITTGIQHEDPEEMLLDRLKELPRELEQLYTDMWQRTNENNSIYRNIAARYFRYALNDRGLVPMFPEVGYPSGYPEIWQPTLFQIAGAESVETQKLLFTGTNAIDFPEVQRLCYKTKLAVQNRCAGLLRVTPPSMRGRMMEIVGSANELDIPQGDEAVDDALFSRVDFIHRTAHDFLTDTEAGQEILNCGQVSDTEVKIRLHKGMLCLLSFLHSEYGVMGRSGTSFYQTIKLFESSDQDGLKEATEMLHVLRNLYDNKVIGADRPRWQPQAPFLSHLTNYTQLDDFVISSLKQASSKTLTEVLRESYDPDLSLRYGNYAPSVRLVKTLISMGADPHARGVNHKREMGSMEPFVRQGTAFTNLLMFGLKSIDEGERLDSDPAREMLKAAVIMAMSCPDWSATTLVIGRVKQDKEASLMNVTWLSNPKTFVHVDSPWLLYEVDLRFLLLRLLSGLAVDIGEDTISGSQVDELLPKLENPLAKIRFIMTCDTESGDAKTLVCHRPSSKLSPSEITDRLFGLGADWTEKSESAYDCTMRLVRDPSLETMDLESAVLSLADEGLGFCTLVEAGVVPPLSYVEHLEEHMPYYAVTLQRLRATAVG